MVNIFRSNFRKITTYALLIAMLSTFFIFQIFPIEAVYAYTPDQNPTVFLTTSPTTIEIGINTCQKWVFTKSGSDWSVEGVYTWNGTSWDKSFDNSGQFIFGYSSLAQSYTVLSDTSTNKKIKFTGTWSNNGPQHDFEYTLECNQGDQWMNLTASIRFATNTSVVDRQFGFGLYTITGMSLDKSLIFGYEPKQAYDNAYNDVNEQDLRSQMPAVAAVISGVRAVNYIMINDYQNTCPSMVRYVKGQHPEWGNNIELAQYTKANIYTAGTWYSMNSKIYIDSDNTKKLNDLIGLAGDKKWNGSEFPEQVLAYPYTPKVKNYQEAVNGVLPELIDPRNMGYLDGVSSYKPYPYINGSGPFSSLDVERGMLRQAKFTNDSNLLTKVMNDVLLLNNSNWIQTDHGYSQSFLEWQQNNDSQLSFADGAVNPYISSGVIPSATFFDDCSTTMGWIPDANVSYASDGSASTLTINSGTFGNVNRIISNVNLDTTPYIVIKPMQLGGSSPYWALNVYNGTETIIIQNNTNTTGAMKYNIKTLTGWSGTQNITIRVYINGSAAGSYVKFDYIGFMDDITKISTWLYYDPIISLGEIASITGNTTIKTMFLNLTTYARTLKWDGYKQALAYNADTRQPLPDDFGGAYGDGNGGGAGMWAYMMFLAYGLTGDTTYKDDGYSALATISNMDYQDYTGHYLYSPKPNVCGWVIRALVKAYELSGTTSYLDKAEDVAKMLYSFTSFNSTPEYDFPTYGWMGACAHERWEAPREMAEAMWIAAPLFQYRFVPTLAKIYLAMKQTWLWTLPINENPRGMYDGYYNFEDPDSAYIPFEVPMKQGGIDGMERYSKETYGAGEIFMMHQMFEAWATSDDPKILVVCPTSVRETYSNTSQKFRIYNPTNVNRTFNIYFNGFALGNYCIQVDGVTKGYYNATQLANGISFTLNAGVNALVEISTGTAPSDTTAPNALTGVTASANDKQQIAINWNASDASDFNHYIVYRSTVAGSNTTKDNMMYKVTGTSYTDDDKDLIPGQTYYYKVTAVDNSGNASIAVEVSATVKWRNFGWINRFYNTTDTSTWIGENATIEKHVYFQYWGYTDLRYAEIKRTSAAQTFGDVYTDVNYDISKSPYLQIKVNSLQGGTTWGLMATDGTNSYTLETSSNKLGVSSYDLKTITGWSGTKSFTIKIYVNGSGAVSGESVSVDWIGATNSVFYDDCSNTTGWIPDANVSYTSDGSTATLTLNSLTFGNIARTENNVNLDVNPYIVLNPSQLGGSGAAWALNVYNGTSTVTLQNNTTSTSQMRYNIRSLTGWTGTQNLTFRVYINGTAAGAYVKLDNIGLLGGMSEDFSNVSDWTYGSDMTMATSGGIATITVNNTTPGYGAVYQGVACNVDNYRYLRIKVASVSKDAQWKLTVGETPDSQVTLQDVTEVTGEYTYDLKALTGWSGYKEFYVFLYALGGNGKYIKVESIRSECDYEYPIPNYVSASSDTQYINMNLGSEVSLNRTTATADSGTNAQYAFDSSYSTAWTSQVTPFPHWLQVDLGQNYKVFDVDIRFGNHYATDYKLQVSTDGSIWTDVLSVTANRTQGWLSGNMPPSRTINHTFIPITARYVRLYATAGNSTDLSVPVMQVHGVVVP